MERKDWEPVYFYLKTRRDRGKGGGGSEPVGVHPQAGTVKTLSRLSLTVLSIDLYISLIMRYFNL